MTTNWTGWITVCIATAVAIIAALQWRTARQKLALDLFDRRFAVFMDVRVIVSHGGRVSRLPRASGFKGAVISHNFDQGLPNEIIARSRFLFGEEIMPLIQKLHELVGLVNMDDSRESMEASHALHVLFEKELIPAFEKYLRFDARPTWF